METYWLSLGVEFSESGRTESTKGDDDDDDCPLGPVSGNVEVDRKTLRLVDWNTNILLRLLAKVVSKRNPKQELSRDGEVVWQLESPTSSTLLDQVAEIITWPSVPFEAQSCHEDDATMTEEVTCQLREYVSSIACMYRDNPFHNFEHASHVAMVRSSSSSSSCPQMASRSRFAITHWNSRLESCCVE
jgi:hypothetical protein